MSARFDADVLVVGDGVAALALACLLRCAQVSVHVVDGRDRAGSPMRGDPPRELPMPLRREGLDVLEDLGVLEEVRAASTPVTHAHLVDRGAREVRFEVGALDGVEEDGPGLVASSAAVIEALETRLAELDGEVERGASIERVETLGGSVYALHVDAEGRRSSRRYRYVVDTLGPLREASGVAFEVVDRGHFHATPLRWTPPRGTVSTFLGPGLSVGMVLPTPPGEAPMLLTRVPLGTGLDLRDLLPRLGAAHLVGELAGPSRPFPISEGIASRFRQGRLLLLAGAAAQMGAPDVHAVNLGLVDAADLGWKLARVARGTSLPSLLDTYDQERRFVAAAVVEMRARHRRLLAAPEGARFSRRDVMIRAMQHSFVRERIARRWLPWKRLFRGPDSLGERVPRLNCRSVPDGSSIELGSLTSGAHFTLLAVGPTDDATLARCADGARAALQNDVGVLSIGPGPRREARWADWTLEDPTGAAASALGVDGPSIVLVRPDGRIAWRGAADAGRLDAQVRAAAVLPEPLRALRTAL